MVTANAPQASPLSVWPAWGSMPALLMLAAPPHCAKAKAKRGAGIVGEVRMGSVGWLRRREHLARRLALSARSLVRSQALELWRVLLVLDGVEDRVCAASAVSSRPGPAVGIGRGQLTQGRR